VIIGTTSKTLLTVMYRRCLNLGYQPLTVAHCLLSALLLVFGLQEIIFMLHSTVYHQGPSLSGCCCSYLEQFAPARYFCTFVACLPVTFEDSSFYYFLSQSLTIVQCSRSDTCHLGHFSHSSYLLTYLLTYLTIQCDKIFAVVFRLFFCETCTLYLKNKLPFHSLCETLSITQCMISSVWIIVFKPLPPTCVSLSVHLRLCFIIIIIKFFNVA